MAFDMVSLAGETRHERDTARQRPPRRVKAKRAAFKGRDAVVSAICTVIREDWRGGVTPTMLNHEGVIRAALRAGLCMSGMGWQASDDAAKEAVQEAFAKAGAKRPRWNEGQPEFCDGGIIRNTRTSCANCGGGLEPEQKLYCCATCSSAHRSRRNYAERMDSARAIERLRCNAIPDAAK